MRIQPARLHAQRAEVFLAAISQLR